MAFLNVNQSKLACLLAQGTHDGELKKFFVDSRIQMILKGARVQNLPHGRNERIRTICERLPPKTDNILRDWFQRNIWVSDPLLVSDVIEYLVLHFDEDEPLAEADAGHIARSALMYLCADAPDRDLLSFLQRAPGSQSIEEDLESTIPISTSKDVDLDSEDVLDGMPDEETPVLHGFELSELIASIVAGDDSAIDEALAPFPQNTRIFVDAIQYARNGEIDVANEHLELLDPDGPELELVRTAITRAQHINNAKSVPTGVHVYLPKHLKEVTQSGIYNIVGTVTNISKAGTVFVRPLFLVEGDKLYLLNYEDRISLFPQSGDVMTYQNVLQRPVKHRDLVHWMVAEYDVMEGGIHFHMESELSPLIEVFKLPVPSSDPDEVRERIKTIASSGRTSVGQQTVFILSDGLAVASPISVDYSREEAFDEPWQAWASIETWLIEGHQYCLDLEHDATSSLDLSPLDTAFRKLLKDLEAESEISISRAQKRELAALLRDRSSDSTLLRTKRVASSLERIALEGEELNAVLKLLGSREEVKRRVEQLVAKRFEKHQAEKSGLQKEIETLERRKSKLVKESRKLERNNKKLADSTMVSVKEAFSKAVNEGVATLTNTEIFRTLMGSGNNESLNIYESVSTGSIESWTVIGALTRSDVKARLMALGLNGRQATVLTELTALAVKSGICFVLKGYGARQYVQVLSRLDCDAIGIIEIPMGLTSGAFLSHAIGSMTDIQRLVLLNVDLSALEAYGARLIDPYFDSELGGQTNNRPLLFSCNGGDMSLPLPNFLEKIAIFVDLNAPWDEGERTLEDIEIDSISLLASLRSRVLEQISTLEESIRIQVERALVKSFAPEKE
ncbi:MAG: hypothetical protein AB2563_06330 [Candidatus Thiodiazotropha endolucinida]